MEIMVEVTQEDIDKTTGGECHKCPIALAIARSVGQMVLVFPTQFTLGGDLFRLPPVAVEFIREFDKKNLVSPITFTLTVPD